MAGTKFWENDPVVGAEAQGGPRPILTLPDPAGDEKRAADAERLRLAQARAAQQAAVEKRAQAEAAVKAKERAIGADATEGERKAAAFLLRALGAEQQYTETGLGPRSYPGQKLFDNAPDLLNQLPGFIGNSDARQVADSSQDEFIAASLRQDSGAAIPPEELERQRRIYFPMPGDGDDAIAAKAQARQRAIEGLKQSAGRLLPMAEERFAGMSGGRPAAGEDSSGALPNAMTRIRIGNPTSPGAAGPGATETSTPYPPALISAHDQMVAQLMVENGGRLDPQAYAARKAELSRQFGYEQASSEADAAWAQSINAFLDAGGRTVPSGMQAEDREMSTVEQIRNTAADSPLGAYAAGTANALTGGTLDEIAGAVGGEEAAEQVQWAKDTLREERPIASFAGEVSGAAMAMVPTARAAQAVGKTALAGEVAYGAAYGAGDNNDNRLLGAVAGAAGAKAGDWIGGKLLQRFGRKVPADAGDEATSEAVEAASDALTPAQKYARAQERGIDLSIGDVRGMGAKAVERGLDVQPGSAQVMNAARSRTQEQMTDAVDDVAAEYGSAATASSMGDALQTGARKWIARAKGEKGNPLDRGVVGKAYDAIPIAAGYPAQRDATLGALEEINAEFSSNPKLRELMKDTQAAKLLDALGDAGSEISWSDLKALRSAVGEDMQGVRIGSQGSRQSTLSRLYGALSEDMRATAAARGPAALAKFERANSLNRAVEARIEGTLTTILGRDGMQSAERAAEKLQAMTVSGRATADFRQLAEIRKSMPKDEWGEVSGALIRLIGHPAKSEGRDFSAETFVKNFADMSAAAKNLLFGGANSTLRQNLDDFVAVASDVAASKGTRNASNTGMAVAGTAGFLVGGGPLSPVSGILALAGQALTSYGAAKLWTHPPFVRWATGYAKLLKAAEKAGVPPREAAVKSHLAHLGRIAKGGGPVSADIIVLKDYLANAAAQSPEKLAAEPTEEGRP